MITRIQPFKTYRPQFTSNKELPKLFTVSKEPFSTDTLNNLANKWAKEELLFEGDSIIIIPKLQLYEAAKIDKKISSTLENAALSELGFAATILEEDGRIDTRALEYFDPKVITILKMVNQIRNNRTYIVPLSAQFIE